MYFLIEDDLLEKYNTIQGKASPNIKKTDSKPVYNKKLLKTKIRSYGDKVRDFHDKEFLRHALIELVQQ